MDALPTAQNHKWAWCRREAHKRQFLSLLTESMNEADVSGPTTGPNQIFSPRGALCSDSGSHRAVKLRVLSEGPRRVAERRSPVRRSAVGWPTSEENRGRDPLSPPSMHMQSQEERRGGEREEIFSCRRAARGRRGGERRRRALQTRMRRRGEPGWERRKGGGGGEPMGGAVFPWMRAINVHGEE